MNWATILVPRIIGKTQVASFHITPMPMESALTEYLVPLCRINDPRCRISQTPLSSAALLYLSASTAGIECLVHRSSFQQISALAAFRKLVNDNITG